MIAACTRSLRAMRMPKGMPSTMQIIVQTNMKDSVRIESSHMPKNPMSIIVITTAAVCSRWRVMK